MKRFITDFNISDQLHEVPPAAFLWSRTTLLKEVMDIVQAAEAWPGVAITADCDGLCLKLRGVLLGHLNWNGRIDLAFRPEVADELVDEAMARRDPSAPDTGRVVFDVRTADDIDRALWLFRFAYLIADSSVTPSANGSCLGIRVPQPGSAKVLGQPGDA